jgi:hypothetical protein
MSTRSLGRQLLRELSSRDEADEFFHPQAAWLHLKHKLGAFVDWHDAYFKGIRAMPGNSTCGPVELVKVRGLKLGILPINAALFCQDDHDHERLALGRRCLDASIGDPSLADADLKVALMHHPIQDLSVIERQHIRAGLVDHLDVILCGHLHEAGFASVGMWTERNLWCAAGATYQTRNWPNTAYYASFKADRLTIFPIRYEDQPREVWTLDRAARKLPTQASFPFLADQVQSFAFWIRRAPRYKRERESPIKRVHQEEKESDDWAVAQAFDFAGINKTGCPVL